jgi:hypothetical protein
MQVLMTRLNMRERFNNITRFVFLRDTRDKRDLRDMQSRIPFV